MAKKHILFSLIILTVVLSGCGVKTRAYLVDKERVDQKIEGNAGYFVGAPSQDDLKPSDKKTRKIFVVEVVASPVGRPGAQPVTTHKEKEETMETKEVVTKTNFQPSQKKSAAIQSGPLELPAITDDAFFTEEAQGAAVTSGVKQTVQYAVEKDDTLQKISKKFYGSYSQWPKIYEANKEVIKDPNFLKPGIVLMISLEE